MNLLDQIFAAKRDALPEKMRREPLAELRQRADDAEPPRGFRRALEQAGRVALIAEVKKATPSTGVLREGFDPLAVARAYQRTGAEALSVLTDVEFFQGGAEVLRAVREAVPMPVLRKDFTVDEYDVWEARAIGADAVLLIVNGLDDEQLRDYRVLAEELGMDALVEVHSEAEGERALVSGATMIGVNNRDLTTFKTSIEVGERVLPSLPETVFRVAESAIRSHDDVRRLTQAGAQAMLIGTAFCREADPEPRVREVMGW